MYFAGGDSVANNDSVHFFNSKKDEMSRMCETASLNNHQFLGLLFEGGGGRW